MAAPNLIVNGQHLVLLGQEGDIGDRNDVATITVPIYVPDVKTALAIRPQDVARTLGFPNLKCTARPFVQVEDGGYEVRYVFEGLNDDRNEPTEITLSFEIDMASEPIETHPNFLGDNGLAVRFGYNHQDGKFARVKPSNIKGDGPGALIRRFAEQAGENPMFGVEQWLKVGGSYSLSYAVTRVPPSVYRGIGTLLNYPPHAELLGIPHMRRRKWLYMGPRVQNRGNAFEVTQTYKLTGPTNGSEAEVYKADQLKDENSQAPGLGSVSITPSGSLTGASL